MITMQENLSIAVKESCIKCGRCVKVCPSGIFEMEDADGNKCVKTVDVQRCIACGHCSAACPCGAVEHNLFPAGKVHKIDYSNMPSPEQVMLLCKARRTNRAFSKEPVAKEHVDMILEAAHRAPPEKLRQIQEFVIDVFGSLVKKLENPLLKPLLKRIVGPVYRYVPIFEKMKEEYAKGNDRILRGATCVIFIHTPKSSRFGDADANLAYENGSLMAESLGISQLYTGFVCTAIKQRKGVLEKMLGLSPDREIKAGMGLGMPEFRYPNYIDKKELQFTEVR